MFLKNKKLNNLNRVRKKGIERYIPKPMEDAAEILEDEELNF